MFSFAVSARPNLASISSRVVGRCMPVPTSTVMEASGFPRRISSSITGRVTALGMGRVWSLVMSVTRFFPRASSRSVGEKRG